tara:strand:- start:85 stop:786 length:702 start_codon:yes stop_codon:yes gene_type:complete
MNFASITNKGSIKKDNEDYLGNIKTKRGHLFAVCDGLSTMKKSKISSRMAINTILTLFSEEENDPIDPIVLIENIIKKAHYSLISLDDDDSVGTTVALVYLENNNIYSAWCGDSRIYHFHNNSIEWISRDHNVLHDILNKGISAGKMYRNPHALTRFLGSNDNHLPEIVKLSLSSNDKLLICTDGLSNFLSEPFITKTINGHDIYTASDILFDALMQQNTGSPDNFTWYLIEI